MQRGASLLGDMLCVIVEKVHDVAIRQNIYKDLIELLEEAKLVSSLDCLLGFDSIFDDAYQAFKKAKIKTINSLDDMDSQR
jgi:hypothetical protein